MYIKKLRRKCSVRGCKCTESYAISRTREMGNSVILCKNCMKEALEAAENYSEDTLKPKHNSSAPPLFFNGNEPIDKIEENVADTVQENKKDFICSECGREFDTEKGLRMHLRSCKGVNDDETEKHI